MRIRNQMPVMTTFAFAGAAWADAPPVPKAQASCAEVEVNGERAPSYGCVTQQLAPTKRADDGRSAQLGSESIGRPPNQLVLYNRADEAKKMPARRMTCGHEAP